MDSDYDISLELVRSLGVGVLSNDEYAHKTSREARKAETDLEDLKQKSFRQISRCWTQFNIEQKEARQEHEEKMMAAMVERELAMFRGEMKKKEEEEDARIRNLYTALIGDARDPAGTTPPPLFDEVHFDVQGSKFLAPIDGAPPIIESPPIRFPPSAKTYEFSKPPEFHTTWDRNIDFVETRLDSMPSSPSGRRRKEKERLRSVIPAPLTGEHGREWEPERRKSPAKAARDGVDIGDLSMPEINPAHNARGTSASTFSQLRRLHSSRLVAHSNAARMQGSPQRSSILKPSARQNAEACVGACTNLNAGSVAKDAEFDEVERILKLNEKKLAKLTALHF